MDKGNYKGPKALYSLYEIVVYKGGPEGVVIIVRDNDHLYGPEGAVIIVRDNDL